MFYCKTVFCCDICGDGRVTQGARMSDCASKDFNRYMRKKEGWKVFYGKYDVCKKCIDHYGLREVRTMMRKKRDDKESD